MANPEGAPGPDSQLVLEPGDTLLLYSDGVIERRDEDLDFGLGRLVATVGGLAGPGFDRLADAIVVEHCVACVDGCCLLAVRLTPAPPG